jgi:uncharacterized protein (TIGR02246 family)
MRRNINGQANKSEGNDMVRISRVAGAAAVSVLASVLAACTPAANTTAGNSTAAAPADSSTIATAIKANETAWNAEWKARDNAKMLTHYTSDAVLVVPNFPAAHGTDEIKKAYDMLSGDKAFTLVFAADRVEVSSSGDMAASSGHYDQTFTDPKTQKVMKEAGNYVTVYKKQADGGWKAVFDIASPSGPDTPAS